MNRLTFYPVPAFLAFSITVGALASPASAGGAPPDIGGLFGAIFNDALAQEIRQLWINRPIAEYNCLEAHNTSAEILANHGISPNDRRVQRMFMQCAQNNASPPGVAPTPTFSAPNANINPKFAIEGLAVGAFVMPDSAPYKAYKCRPSTDYPGFQWCGRHRPMKGSSGPYDEYMTIFHSGAYQAVLMLQDIIPAFFAVGDVDREIQRLSRRFGQSPHVYSGRPSAEAPHSIIAVWGDVVLTPLDIDNVEALQRGETIHAGLMVDFLGDSKRSVTLGMPVFHIGGGAGYIWSAKYDESGKGRLRITAVNATLLPGATPEPAPPTPQLYLPTPTPAPAPPLTSEMPHVTSSPVKLSITDKDKFLIDGDLKDVVLLYNANASAPHIAQNLRGEYVFSGDSATVCLFGENPDGFALGVKQTLLTTIAPRTVTLTATSNCEVDKLLGYDIVATQRGAFLRSPRDAALALIKTVEDNDFRKFAIVSAADLAKTAAAEKEAIEKVRTYVADQAPLGFGIVLLKTGSSNLCYLVDDKAEAHRNLLLRSSDKISLDMQAEVVLKPTTAEDAFVGVQRRQCGGVYASGANLKTLTAALERNGIPFAFSGLWRMSAEVDQEDAAITQKAHPLTAIAAANKQLQEAQSFIKTAPQSPQLLDYVDHMSALSAAVKTGDADLIDRSSTELSALLSHDKDYQRYLADVEKERKERTARHLVEAIRQGEQQRAFIMDYIGKNPVSDMTPRLALLVKELTPALQKDDLEPLQRLVDEIAHTISDPTLQEAFAAWKIPPVTPSTPSPVKLPITDKNKFLIDGDLEDVVLLYNANASAPHIAQNLRGEYVFSGDSATVCLFGENPDGFALGVKQTLLTTIAPRTVTLTATSNCEVDKLLGYDIVATQRGAFLRSPRDAALALIKTVEDNDFRKFAIVSAADLAKTAAAEKEAIEKVRTYVADQAPLGFGIVLLKTGSSNLCYLVDDKAEAHRNLLLRSSDKISLDMQAEVVLKPTTAEDAFVGVQRRQCGGVYASGANLKTLTAALERNGIPFAFSGLWRMSAEVDQEDAAITQKAHDTMVEDQARAQRNADAARLVDERAKDLNSTRAARQAALRAEFGNAAKAAAASLGADIITWPQNPQSPVALAYPNYATFLNGKFADYWEIMTTDATLQDFGVTTFKGRQLDSVFTRVTWHLKNRILGEYKDVCMIFGRINDTEFSTSREHVVAQCDDPTAITAWQVEHQFKSEWFVIN